MESIANVLDVLKQPPVSRLAYKGKPKVMSKTVTLFEIVPVYLKEYEM
jgi:hypothetical protein